MLMALPCPYGTVLDTKIEVLVAVLHAVVEKTPRKPRFSSLRHVAATSGQLALQRGRPRLQPLALGFPSRQEALRPLEN